MLKIMCLNPVTLETTEEEIAYIGKYLDKDTRLIPDGVSQGPETIQSEYQEALAQPQIIELCMEAEKQGMDGVFVNCFGDPGVRGAREVTNIPIFGGFEPVMLTAMGIGDRIGILSVLDNVLPLITNEVLRAGMKDRVVSISSIGIPVAQLQDKEALEEALVREALRVIREHGVEVLVLGCTAMIDVAENVAEKLHVAGYHIPVLEAAQTAVKMLEMFAKMGLTHSRRTYMPVPVR
ncbi:MAG: hydrogenase expression protein HupH [Lachnospiraceae bacterium]|nr:hydrogenase expression protein HupH [Lachnospiraceae bacterium]